MRLPTISAAALSILFSAAITIAAPDDGVITGKVTFTGMPAKPEVIDMSKQPECAKLRTRLTTEKVVIGPDNALQHVVVYISSGESDIRETERVPARFDQQGCRYTTHVLALRVGQEVVISNSDPFNHNIHPLPKINREWNKIQLPGPAFSYSYDKEEFIPVKCNIHSWMGPAFVSEDQSFCCDGKQRDLHVADPPAWQIYQLRLFGTRMAPKVGPVTVFGWTEPRR